MRSHQALVGRKATTTTADGVKHTFLVLAQRIDGAVQLGASNLAANRNALSKKVSTLNFRQYGQMEKQPGRSSDMMKIRHEKITEGNDQIQVR